MIILKYIEYQEKENIVMLYFEKDKERIKYSYDNDVFDILAKYKLKKNMVITYDIFMELRDLHIHNIFMNNMKNIDKEKFLKEYLNNNDDIIY